MTTRAKDHSPPYEFGSPIDSSTLGSPLGSSTLGSPISSAMHDSQLNSPANSPLPDATSSIYPKMKVRTGFKTFNPKIMMGLVVMESVFKVDARKAPGLLHFIFEQEWILGEDVEEKSQKKT